MILYNRRIKLTIIISLIIILLSSCIPTRGSIVILENGMGTGFTMEFNKWSDKNKCELSLEEGDILQFEIICDSGELNLVLKGKHGSEPYEGNIIESRKFTVRISENDEYITWITGKNASGKVIVKNLGKQ